MPRYPFMLEPDQLIWLCHAIDVTREAGARDGGQGCIVEVGVARGQTSTFLLTHMQLHGDRRPYYCIDTFSGFTAADRDHEVSQRAKPAAALNGFTVNDRAAVEQNLKRQGFDNAIVIEADAGAFGWSRIAPIDVLLLDVDLYRPTKAVLTASRPHWSSWAHVLVDDVKPDDIFDGAHQAYVEFCEEQRLPIRLVGGKAGVVAPPEQAVAKEGET